MRKAGHIFIRFLIGICSVLLLLVLAIGGVGFWAYQNPTEAFHVVEKYLLPSDLRITWQRAHATGEWLGGLDFNIDLSVEGLDVSKTSPSFYVPLDHARIKASIFPLRRTATIHLVEAAASEPIEFHGSADETPVAEKNPFQQIQSVLSILNTIHERVPIEAADLRARSFVFYPAEGAPFGIQATLHQDIGQPLMVTAAFDLPGESELAFTVNGAVDFKKMSSPDAFLNAQVGFDGAGVSTQQTLTGVYTGDTAQLKTTGPLKFSKNKMHLTFNPILTAKFNPREAELHLISDVSGIPGPLARVEKVDIHLKTPLETGESWSDKSSKFTVAAPIALFFVDQARRAKMETACGCKLPETVMTRAEGEIWLRTLLTMSPKKRPALDSKITIESVKNKIFVIDLAGQLKIEKEATEFLFSPQLNCTAIIQSFKALRPMLDAYNVLIPAPLDVLDGTLNFKANGPIASDEKGSTFPISLDADLLSTTQKVKMATTATVLLDPKFTSAHVDVKAKIANLNLDLPPLDPLGGMPRVAPDSRFKKKPDVKNSAPSKFKLSFNFEVETEKDGAIRLASRYFHPYLPLTLKIQSDGAKDNSGFIQSESFDVTYLRRTVRVESLRLGLDSDDKGIFPIKGRLIVKQTDYTVFIDVEGTTKSPNVTMSSEPYLPQNDIIAVLLYDRVNDQLVSGDAETTGGVQAAIADRAIGLFGLWAFAATPIKSFSYNPVTKVYTATVAVSDDLTAGIGTNWEESAHLELRKRVSKRWSLTAAYLPATQDDSATTKLVLQWEKRF
ncbi:hypothetical protein BH10BDE1_BH10BDE1_15780 [soil metagenome]